MWLITVCQTAAWTASDSELHPDSAALEPTQCVQKPVRDQKLFSSLPARWSGPQRLPVFWFSRAQTVCSSPSPCLRLPGLPMGLGRSREHTSLCPEPGGAAGSDRGQSCAYRHVSLQHWLC